MLLGKKAKSNLDKVSKSKDIALPTSVRIVKAMVFSVVMYGCENGNIKKAECRRIDAFKLKSWRRLLKVPETAGRSNQPILKEINPKYSLEGLILKVKLQYFGHLMLGKIKVRRRRRHQRIRWLDGFTDAMDMNLGNSGR